MSNWGIWPTDDGEQHIVPCDERSNVIGGHIRSAACHCDPVPDADEPLVIIHNDPERGGFNA